MSRRAAVYYKSTRVGFQPPTLGVDAQQDGMPEGSDGRLFVESSDEVRCLCVSGQLDEALDVTLRMDKHGIVPSETVYWSLLKACNERKAAIHAKLVYVHLAKHGLVSNFLGEYLVITLSKCGDLEDALQVFHGLPRRTVFSWTAVISGCTDRGKGEEALDMFQQMREEGVHPNQYTYVSLFKACGTLAQMEETVGGEGRLSKTISLRIGMALHVGACKKGFDSHAFVSNTILSMYGKYKSIVEATNVFVSLSHCDVVSCNAMLSAYVEHGEGQEALQLYLQMQKKGVSPNERTYVVALQGCCTYVQNEGALVMEGQLIKVTTLDIVQAIHTDVEKKGFDSSIFVGSALVSLYGKCASILEAQEIFHRLQQHNVVSWAVLLSAYVEQGEGERALHLYRDMHGEGLIPNERTLVILLQACCNLRDEGAFFMEKNSTKLTSLEIARAFHIYVEKQGLDTDVFVGSALVNAFGKHGDVMEAERVLHGLSCRNVVAWTAMLSVYVEQDEGEKALQMYRQMQEVGICLDDRTYVTVLQACCTIAEKEEGEVLEGLLTKVVSLKIGQAIHADVQNSGFDADSFVCSTLVSMYGKCGRIVEAENLFRGFPKHNVVLWTAMLSAYVEQCKAKKVIQLYGRLLKDGISPMEQTFLSALQACCMLALEEEASIEAGQWVKSFSLKLGQALHADALREGFDVNTTVINALISMYGDCRSILEAENVFSLMLQPDVVSWNSMLSVYVEQWEEEMALQLYRELEEQGVTPDELTLVITLKGCCVLAEREAAIVDERPSIKVVSLEIGLGLHANAQMKGFDSYVFVSNALISMYGKCGTLLEAEAVFDALPHHNNIVSWNAMLSIYVGQGQADKALQLYRQLLAEEVMPDDTTYVCVLQGCCETGRLDICLQIHLSVVSAICDPSLVLSNTLIHAYGGCGSMKDAQIIFDALPLPDHVSWTSLITGYAQGGDLKASLKFFEQMQLAGSKANRITFLSLLCACSHNGCVQNGLEHFEYMSKDYGMTPGIEHYGSIADMFGRAGDFARVEDWLSRMTVQPDMTIWLCLLGACQNHDNWHLGKQMLVYSRHLWPKQTGRSV